MKVPLRVQLDLFTVPARLPQLSGNERVKAVALLQSLLIEAAATPAAKIRELKETGDEQDHS